MPEPSSAPDWLNVPELIRRAKAESAAEIAMYGCELPTLLDWAEAAAEALRAGYDALIAGDYVAAHNYLQQAVTGGIEEARPLLEEAVAWEQLRPPEREGPENA